MSGFNRTLVLVGVFLLAILLHYFVLTKEGFATAKTPLTKDNVQALLDEFVLELLAAYKKIKDEKSKDNRLKLRLYLFGNVLRILNEQYPAFQHSIANTIQWEQLSMISLEDLRYIKTFLTYRVSPVAPSSLLTPASLSDLDLLSNRITAFNSFLAQKAPLAKMTIPTEYNTSMQTILANLRKVKLDIPGQKENEIPILKSDLYTIVFAGLLTNFVPPDSLEADLAVPLVTPNLPSTEKPFNMLANALSASQLTLSNQPLPASTPSPTTPSIPVPAQQPAPVQQPLPAPTAQPEGLKFSELISALLAYTPSSSPSSTPSPSTQPNVFPSLPVNKSEQAPYSSDYTQNVGLTPKDEQNKKIESRIDETTMTPSNKIDKESPNLYQGNWFRRGCATPNCPCASGGSCPYTQGQSSCTNTPYNANGILPQPIPPFDMSDYIRKDSIPCWNCKLK